MCAGNCDGRCCHQPYTTATTSNATLVFPDLENRMQACELAVDALERELDASISAESGIVHDLAARVIALEERCDHAPESHTQAVRINSFEIALEALSDIALHAESDELRANAATMILGALSTV